jgi:hypothetical protein
MELQLPPGTTLESAPAIEIKLRASESLPAAIAAVRKEIAGVQQSSVSSSSGRRRVGRR